MGSKLDLTGHKYGRLTVMREADKRTMGGSVHWSCMCDCGKTHIVYSCHLRSGHTKSCGCLSVETAIKTFTTHGKSNTPEYTCWEGIINRCYNKSNRSYRNYGGRGISVCKRWRNSFINFLNDMGLKPNPNLTIERINNNRNYNVTNCKWTTHTIQSRNQRKRKDNASGVVGVSWCNSKSKWTAHIGLNNKQIMIGRFKIFKDAVDARKRAEREYWNV